MAFASSRKISHEIKIPPCDLCEEDRNTYWFCINCVQNLCERCKRLHLRSNASVSHKVVLITEYASNERTISTICPYHNELFLYLCGSCEKEICSICLATQHNHHDFKNLKEVQSEAKEELYEVIERKEKEKDQMQMNYDSLVQYQIEYEMYLKEQYAIIDDRVNAIELAATTEGLDLKEAIRSRYENQVKLVVEVKQKIKARITDYDEEIKCIQREFRIQMAPSLNGFIQKYAYKLSSLRPLSIVIPHKSHQFTFAKVDTNHLRDMIGKLEKRGTLSEIQKSKVQDEEKYILSDLKIIRRYDLNDLHIIGNSICPSPDGCIWIGSDDYVVKLSSDCTTIMHMIPSSDDANGNEFIACLLSGDALSSYNDHIDRFTFDGRRERFAKRFGTDCLIFQDIAVTSDDEVVVSTGPGAAIFTNTGERLRDIAIEGINIRFFCLDNDGNITTYFKNENQLRFYDSVSGQRKQTWPTFSFYSRHLTSDRYGNVLLWNNYKSIFLFNKDGKYKEIFSINIDDIIGISLNDEGDLMILAKVHSRKKYYMRTEIFIAKYLQ